jgi:hypothetical protein
MWHIREREEVHTGFWCGNLRRDNFENLDVDWRMILKWTLHKPVSGGRGLNLSGSELRQVAECGEHVMNIRVPQNAGNFLTG